MKFGVNTFVWVSPCTTEAVKDLAPKVKSMRFDILEVSVETPGLIDAHVVNDILKKNKIESFTSQVKEIARSVCIWREIAPSQDAIAQQGLQFLQTLFA